MDQWSFLGIQGNQNYQNREIRTRIKNIQTSYKMDKMVKSVFRKLLHLLDIRPLLC